MSTKLKQFLELNNIRFNEKGLKFQVHVTSKKEILELLKFANLEHVPVFYNYTDEFEPFTESASTSCIFLIFEKFDKILEINITNRYVIVQPRVKARLINQILKKDNFSFLPVLDDNSDLNIGQLILRNVISENLIKTADCVLGLEVILPNGEIIKTGSKTLKSVSGYDITSLYIGSQGIFGIVTEAILRIDPIVDHYLKPKMSMPQEQGFSEGELTLLRKLKKVIDPNNVLNSNLLI